MPATEKILFRIQGKDEGASAAAKRTADALARLEKEIRKTNATSSRTMKSLKGLVGQVTSLNSTINLFGATIRQIGQGMQNFGTIMSIFVTAPIAGAMKATADAVLDLDDALIEARKNAGLTREETEQLRKKLLELSSVTPTDIDALGKIAADAGRLGIKGVDNIVSFTKAIDQLQVATVLTAETAATHIGRLVNIFQEDLKKGTKNFEQFVVGLGSAINELGQNVAANEEEIVQAALRIAPAGKAIGLAAPDVLALAASIVEVSASAQRGGTQVASALTQVAQKAVDVADAFGLNVEAFRAMVEENPAETILAIFDAIGRIEDPLKRSAAAAELLGRVGGKAGLALLQNMEGVQENLAIARKAFQDGTSLAQEFERAMDSVRNQLRLVRNNLLLVGTALADSVLPEITQLSALAVPVAQRVAEAFNKMSAPMRRNIILIASAVAILGPLSLILGSILFSMGIVITGITTGVGFLVQAGTAIVHVIGLLSSLLSPIGLLVAAIAGIGIVLLNSSVSLQEFFEIFKSLVSQAADWGYKLIASFAEGIVSAASLVVNAIVSVINAFIGYIRAFSPPKQGPLKDIRKWGRGVAQAFLDGFSDADTSPVLRFVGIISEKFESLLRSLPAGFVDIFSDLGGLLDRALSALGGALGMEDSDIAASIENAKEVLAEFLSAAASGMGDLSEIMDRLRSALGNFGDDFAYLLRLQLEYNAAQEDLKRIKDELAGLNDALNEEVDAIAKRTDLTAEERAALIRDAKRKTAVRRRDLKEEEKAAEKKVDSIEEEIDAQRELIRILIEALKAREKIADAIDKLPKPGGGTGGGISLPELNPGEISAGIDDAKEKIENFFTDVTDKADSFASKISEAKQLVDGFIAGLTGENIDPIEFETLGEKFHDGFEKGAAVRRKIRIWLASLLSFKRKLDLIGAALSTGFENAKKKIDELGIGEFITGQIKKAIQAFVDNFGEQSTFYQNAVKVKDVLGNIAGNIAKLGLAALMALFGGLPAFSAFMGSFAGILSNVLQKATGIIGVLSEFADIVIFGQEENDIDKLRTALSLINPELEKFAPKIAEAATGLRNFANQALTALQNINFGYIASGVLAVIVLGGALMGIPGAMLGAIATIGFLALAIGKTEEPLQNVKDAWEGLKSGFQAGFGVDEQTLQNWSNTFSDFAQAIADIAAAITLLVDSGAEATAEDIQKGGLAGLMEFIGFITGETFRSAIDAVADLADGFTRLVGSVEFVIGFFTNNPELVRRGADMMARSLQNTADRLKDNADRASEWEANIFNARAAIFEEDAETYAQIAETGATMADLLFGGIEGGLEKQDKVDSIRKLILNKLFGTDFEDMDANDVKTAAKHVRDGLLLMFPGGFLAKQIFEVGDSLAEIFAESFVTGIEEKVGSEENKRTISDSILGAIFNVDVRNMSDADFLKAIRDFNANMASKLPGGPIIGQAAKLGGFAAEALMGAFVKNLKKNRKKEFDEAMLDAWGLGDVDVNSGKIPGHPKLVKKSQDLGDTIMQKITGAVKDAYLQFDSIYEALKSWWSEKQESIKSKAKDIGEAVANAISDAISTAKNMFDGISSALSNWLSDQTDPNSGFLGVARSIGGFLVSGILHGIQSSFHRIVDWLKAKISSLDWFGWLTSGGNDNEEEPPPPPPPTPPDTDPSGGDSSIYPFGFPGVGGVSDTLSGVIGSLVGGFGTQMNVAPAYNITVNINGANIDRSTARSIAEEIGRELDRIQRRRL